MDAEASPKSFSIADGMILIAGYFLSCYYISINYFNFRFWYIFNLPVSSIGVAAWNAAYCLSGFTYLLKDLAPLALIQNLTIAAISIQPRGRSSTSNGLGRAGNLSVYCGVAVSALVCGFSAVIAIPIFLTNMSMQYGLDLYSLEIHFERFFSFVGLAILTLWVHIALTQGARIERDWLGAWSVILSLFWIIAALSAATSRSLYFLTS